jgi:hypothetical protein
MPRRLAKAGSSRFRGQLGADLQAALSHRATPKSYGPTIFRSASVSQKSLSRGETGALAAPSQQHRALEHGYPQRSQSTPWSTCVTRVKLLTQRFVKFDALFIMDRRCQSNACSQPVSPRSQLTRTAACSGLSASRPLNSSPSTTAIQKSGQPPQQSRKCRREARNTYRQLLPPQSHRSPLTSCQPPAGGAGHQCRGPAQSLKLALRYNRCHLRPPEINRPARPQCRVTPNHDNLFI